LFFFFFFFFCTSKLIDRVIETQVDLSCLLFVSVRIDVSRKLDCIILLQYLYIYVSISLSPSLSRSPRNSGVSLSLVFVRCLFIYHKDAHYFYSSNIFYCEKRWWYSTYCAWY